MFQGFRFNPPPCLPFRVLSFSFGSYVVSISPFYLTLFSLFLLVSLSASRHLNFSPAPPFLSSSRDDSAFYMIAVKKNAFRVRKLV